MSHCPRCAGLEESLDRRIRQVTQLQSRMKLLKAHTTALRGALERIANGEWEKIQDAVRLPDDSDSVKLEGDYASDARYHYPYRMTVLRRFAYAALRQGEGEK